MFETIKVNRVVQFAYPTLIFLAALLACNAVGQVGVARRMPLADRKAAIHTPLYCSVEESHALAHDSCTLNPVGKPLLVNPISFKGEF